VRAHGLLAAIELHPPPAGARALAALQQRGLYAAAVASAIAAEEAVLVLPAVGEANVLRIIPPLIIEPAEIDRAAAALDAVLTRLERGSLD
jgi:acetylornithine/succinyldiaminopimelate/putrescine aminotransferase